MRILEFHYNIEKLEQIMHDLSVLTGISMAFLDTRHRYLCQQVPDNDFCTAIQCSSEARKKCHCSDQLLLSRCSRSLRFESHFCHAGLYDACLPILKDQALAGFVLMGRIRLAGAPVPPEWGEDNRLAGLYRQIPCFTDRQIQSLSTLLPEILFQGAIRFDDFLQEIVDYIRSNLQEEIGQSVLCARFGVSKNRLYQIFHQTYGCSVGDYIARLRLERAKELLLQTRVPVYAVAEQTGIPSCTYFCRIFKAKTGMSPTQYRTAFAEK